MPRGAFVVVEGLDRSGKTTQVADLCDRLRQAGKEVVQMKFPDRTTVIGQMINAYLTSQADFDDHAIHLLFSANRWESVSRITHLLEAGTTIICDRYAFSGIAFSASKGLPFDWCRQPDVGLPAPDLVIFLDISPETAMARGGYGQERYEKEEMQKKVRELYGRIQREGSVRWRTVDAGQERQVVREAIWQEMEGLLDVIEKPVGRLWQS